MVTDAPRQSQVAGRLRLQSPNLASFLLWALLTVLSRALLRELREPAAVETMKRNCCANATLPSAHSVVIQDTKQHRVRCRCLENPLRWNVLWKEIVVRTGSGENSWRLRMRAKLVSCAFPGQVQIVFRLRYAQAFYVCTHRGHLHHRIPPETASVRSLLTSP